MLESYKLIIDYTELMMNIIFQKLWPSAAIWGPKFEQHCST